MFTILTAAVISLVLLGAESKVQCDESSNKTLCQNDSGKVTDESSKHGKSVEISGDKEKTIEGNATLLSSNTLKENQEETNSSINDSTDSINNSLMNDTTLQNILTKESNDGMIDTSNLNDTENLKVEDLNNTSELKPENSENTTIENITNITSEKPGHLIKERSVKEEENKVITSTPTTENESIGKTASESEDRVSSNLNTESSDSEKESEITTLSTETQA